METTATVLLKNKKEVPSEFDKIAKKYDLATYLSQGYMDDLRISAQRMNLKGNETVLDLCCGTGKSTLACLEQVPNGKVVGVDNSKEMLETAKQKLGSAYAGKVSFQLQDAMLLDFPDNSFDAIFMAYGIRNMPDYEKCVQNLYRILKPGGTICFHEYSLAENFYAKPYWAVMGYGFIVPFCTLLTGNFTIFNYLVKSVMTFLRPSVFKNLLAANGFKEVNAIPLKSWRKPLLHTFIAKK
jgi:ubiquinone/menaquinone biosynthesis methyltransferase